MDKGRVATHGTDRRAEGAERPGLRAAGQGRRAQRSSASLRAAGLEVPRDRRGRHAGVRARRRRRRRAICSRWRPAHGVQVRHLRPSVPTLEDVFAAARSGERNEPMPDPRSGLSALRRQRGRTGRAWWVIARPASARVLAQARVPGAAADRLGAVPRPRGADLRRRQLPAGVVPRADGARRSASSSTSRHLRLLRHHLRRRRADRQRSPRQRAADLPVEAADARRVHRRQAGDPDRRSCCWSPGCRRCSCCWCRSRSPAASRSSATTCSCCRRSRCSSLVQVAAGVVRDAGAVVAVEEQPLRRHHVRRAHLLHRGDVQRVYAASPAQPWLAWLSPTDDARRSSATRSSGCRRAIDVPVSVVGAGHRRC